MQERDSKKLLGLLFILGSMMAIGPLSIDMYLPAFSVMAMDLNTTPELVGYTLTSYLLGIGIGQIILGPFTDRYGRKRPTQIGLIVFTIASLGIALATSVHQIIGLRILMAFGACIGIITSKAIVRDLFEPQYMARVFSMLMLVMGIAPILAPTIGGYIVAGLGWRYIFYLLTAYSFLIILSITFFLKETKAPDKDISLKPRAIFREYGTVFKNRNFLYFSFAGSLLYSGLFAYISGASFIYVEMFQYSHTSFGWTFGLNAAGYITGAQINNYVLKKRRPADISRVVTVFQASIALLMIVTLFIPSLTEYGLVGGIWLFLFSLGFITPNTTTESLAPFTKIAGSASALIGGMQMGFGALISGIISFSITDSVAPVVITMAVCSLGGAILLQAEYRSRNKEKQIEEALN